MAPFLKQRVLVVWQDVMTVMRLIPAKQDNAIRLVATLSTIIRPSLARKHVVPVLNITPVSLMEVGARPVRRLLILMVSLCTPLVITASPV